MARVPTVTAIRLQNFMGFEDTDWIELRSITLLFGRNSTGKSSIIRALLLLRQSMSARDKEEPLIFAADEGVDLGSFLRMVRGRDEYDKKPNSEESEPGRLRQMVFGFRCSMQQEVLFDLIGETEKEILSEAGEATLDLSLGFQWNTDSRQSELSTITLEAPFSARGDGSSARTIFQAEWGEINHVLDWYLSTDFGYELYIPDNKELPEETKVYKPTITIKRRQIGFLPEIDHPSNLTDDTSRIPAFFKPCFEAIEALLTQIRYLGPLRYEPHRVYVPAELSRNIWESKGKTTIRDFLTRDLSDVEKTCLYRWLDTLGLGEELHIDPLFSRDDKLPSAYHIDIYEGGETRDINIKEVGYGAAQVLPIVLQSVLAPEEALIIIEQPELHLHPTAQADLADLFIEMVNDSKGIDEGVRRRFLIETHSESILLRSRVRLAQTFQGKPDDRLFLSEIEFICFFVEKLEGVSKIEPMRFGEDGSFIDSPLGFAKFFAQDTEELLKLKKAHLGIIRKEKKDDSHT